MSSPEVTSARRRTAAHACPSCEQPWAVRATRNPDGLFLLVCRFCAWREVRGPATSAVPPAPAVPVPSAVSATDARDRRHCVLFAEDDGHLVSCWEQLVAGALDEGASCLVFATEAHRSALLERLGAHRAASPRLVLLDAEQMLGLLLRDGRPDPVLFEISVGALVRDQGAEGRPVRAFGEMTGLLWARGDHEAALELELLWGRLGDQLGLSLVCAYPAPAGAGAAGARARICEHHTAAA